MNALVKKQLHDVVKFDPAKAKVGDAKAGEVTAAILLTNNNTDTKWWHRSAKTATAICFTSGRINFYKADGTETQPTNGQTFFYFGDEVEAFLKAFGQFGLIMGRA